MMDWRVVDTHPLHGRRSDRPAAGRSRALRTVLVLSVFLVALCGCSLGLPIDDAPRRIDVPPDVFPEPEVESPVSSPQTPEFSLHAVYFLRSGRLVELQRPLGPPVLLDAPLNELLLGPTPSEAEFGLVSAIPAGTEIVDVQLSRNNVVSIHLNEVFFEVEGAQRIRAIAQLVLTAFALARDTQGVLFYLDGIAQSVPDGAGTIAEVRPGEFPTALRVDDFDEFLPLIRLDGGSAN